MRAVAANPAAHLGQLTLTGVVGIATLQKGFVLVDMAEYQAEGLSCLNTSEKTKFPSCGRAENRRSNRRCVSKAHSPKRQKDMYSPQPR